MKNTCREYQNDVQPFLNRQLKDREMKAFLEHVETCSRCRDELETYFIVDYSLRYLEHEEDRTYDIQHLLEERIREETKDLKARSLLRAMIPIAISLVIFAGIILAIRDLAPELLQPIQDFFRNSIEELWRVR